MERRISFQSRVDATAGMRLFAAGALVAVGLVAAVEHAGAQAAPSVADASAAAVVVQGALTPTLSQEERGS